MLMKGISSFSPINKTTADKGCVCILAESKQIRSNTEQLLPAGAQCKPGILLKPAGLDIPGLLTSIRFILAKISFASGWYCLSRVGLQQSAAQKSADLFPVVSLSLLLLVLDSQVTLTAGLWRVVTSLLVSTSICVLACSSPVADESVFFVTKASNFCLLNHVLITTHAYWLSVYIR